ncbi:asparaginase domain-containing protein [Halothiobacillus sp. DCM-1]|uniref:asparaginase domain-containing protein n=1 Tax=Halothiobacillus sp. DCM-1 TaxID=3112558 RepID=UPI003251A648
MKSSHPSLPLVLINTGGTFNKRYNPLNGALEIPADNRSVLDLLRSAQPNLRVHAVGLLHKDSLDITEADRAQLVEVIRTLPEAWRNAPIVIVHGTDTLDQTAQALEAAQLNRFVVLTGSMRPVEIDPIEPAIHLGLALGFIAANPPNGVYVAMHGLVKPHHQMVKDRDIGQFRPKV